MATFGSHEIQKTDSVRSPDIPSVSTVADSYNGDVEPISFVQNSRKSIQIRKPSTLLSIPTRCMDKPNFFEKSPTLYLSVHQNQDQFESRNASSQDKLDQIECTTPCNKSSKLPPCDFCATNHITEERSNFGGATNQDTIFHNQDTNSNHKVTDYLLEPERVNPKFNRDEISNSPICENQSLCKRTKYQPRKNGQIVRGAPSRKTQRRKKGKFIYHSCARRNSILLAKKHGYKPKAVRNEKRASDNFYSAIFTLIFCCPPLGVAALICAFKVRSYHASGDHTKAQQSSLLGRKFANTGIMLGMTTFAFVLIYFVLKWNIPFVSVEFEDYADYNNW